MKITAHVKILGLGVVLVLFGCAKKREAVLPSEQVSTTFSISEIRGLHLRLRAVELTNPPGNNWFEKESNSYNLDESEAPERFRFLIRGVEFSGQPKQSGPVDVVFSVDSKEVTGYKFTQSRSGLTSLEQSLALTKEEFESVGQEPSLSKRSRLRQQDEIRLKKLERLQSLEKIDLYVPLFKFKIQSQGRVEPVKNEMGEETSVLRLRKTDWIQATHIQISDISQDRQEITLDSSAQSDLELVRPLSLITEKVLSSSDLENLLSGLHLSEEIHLRANSHYWISLEKAQVRMYEAVLDNDITKKEPTHLRKTCPNTLAKPNCILLARYELPLVPVQAQLSEDNDKTHLIVFKEEKSGKALFIRKNKDPKVQSLSALPAPLLE